MCAQAPGGRQSQKGSHPRPELRTRLQLWAPWWSSRCAGGLSGALQQELAQQPGGQHAESSGNSEGLLQQFRQQSSPDQSSSGFGRESAQQSVELSERQAQKVCLACRAASAPLAWPQRTCTSWTLPTWTSRAGTGESPAAGCPAFAGWLESGLPDPKLTARQLAVPEAWIWASAFWRSLTSSGWPRKHSRYLTTSAAASGLAWYTHLPQQAPGPCGTVLCSPLQLADNTRPHSLHCSSTPSAICCAAYVTLAGDFSDQSRSEEARRQAV